MKLGKLDGCRGGREHAQRPQRREAPGRRDRRCRQGDSAQGLRAVGVPEGRVGFVSGRHLRNTLRLAKNEFPFLFRFAHFPIPYIDSASTRCAVRSDSFSIVVGVKPVSVRRRSQTSMRAWMVMTTPRLSWCGGATVGVRPRSRLTSLKLKCV